MMQNSRHIYPCGQLNRNARDSRGPFTHSRPVRSLRQLITNVALVINEPNVYISLHKEVADIFVSAYVSCSDIVIDEAFAPWLVWERRTW
jgi:hypothetical protein